jgi:hypothetical protein
MRFSRATKSDGKRAFLRAKVDGLRRKGYQQDALFAGHKDELSRFNKVHAAFAA